MNWIETMLALTEDAVLLITEDGSILQASYNATQLMACAKLTGCSLQQFIEPAWQSTLSRQTITLQAIGKESRQAELHTVPFEDHWLVYIKPQTAPTFYSQALFEQAHDAIFILDLKGRHLAVNRKAANLLGYTVAELLQLSVYKLSAELSDSEQVLKRLLSGETIPIYERLFRHKDGTLIPVEINVELVRDGMGQPLHIQSFVRDISARKKVLKELDSTAARFRQLIGNLNSGVLVENEYRRIEVVNTAFCQMFDITAPIEALIGADCSDTAEQTKHLFVDPETFVERINAVLLGQKMVLNDKLHLRDGRILERDYIPIFVGDDYRGHLWQYRDITEHVQTQQRQERLVQIEKQHHLILKEFLLSESVDTTLNQALGKVGTLLNVSRVYVFHFRQNERLLDNTHEWCAEGVNPEIENLKGLPFDELVPSFFPLLTEKGILQASDIHTLPADIYDILAPQRIQSVLIVPLHFDGRVEGFIGFDEIRQQREWLPEEITIVRTLADSYARVLERQRSQQALVEARDAALRSARLKSQFVSNMSHEIRTPMTGMLGMLELLQETVLDEDQTEFVQTAHTSALRLTKIINDILDFSKIEAGQVSLIPETFRLAGILREVQTTLAPLAARNEVHLLTQLATDIPQQIVGDATRLQQVLMNLVGNALKFTQRGQVIMRVERLSATDTHVRLRFEVTDTGIGIEKHQLSRIFDSFIQADNTITRKYGGTGLGLAISKQLVELMGGCIDVQSIPGQGSTFGFTLLMPYLQNDMISTTDDNTGFAQLHVLIVDAEDTARYVLSQQIRMLGAMTTALSNEEVLSETRKFIEAAPLCEVALVRCAGLPAEQAQLAQTIRRVMGTTLKLLVGVYDVGVSLETEGFDLYLPRPLRQSVLHDTFFSIVHPSLTVLNQATETPAQNAPRILVAEDYIPNQKMLLHALQDQGLKVDVADDGAIALDMLAQEQYALLLLDVQMPVLDGLQMIRLIRENPNFDQAIPIIALTASVLPQEVAHYLALGFNEVIAKPFSINKLRQIVRSYLPPHPSG